MIHLPDALSSVWSVGVWGIFSGFAVVGSNSRETGRRPAVSKPPSNSNCCISED